MLWRFWFSLVFDVTSDDLDRCTAAGRGEVDADFLHGVAEHRETAASLISDSVCFTLLQRVYFVK